MTTTALTIPPSGPADLLGLMERQIVQRTWGRVDHLRIERVNDRIVVHGSAPSYYVKQLVLEAALTSLDAGPALGVSLDIRIRVHTARARDTIRPPALESARTVAR